MLFRSDLMVRLVVVVVVVRRSVVVARLLPAPARPPTGSPASEPELSPIA